MSKYTQRVGFSLPVEVKDRIKEAARREGISMSELIRRITRDFLAPAQTK